MRPRLRLLLPAVGVLLLSASAPLRAGEIGSAGGTVEQPVATGGADAAWRSELEELCAGASDAMTFSREELQRRVARCDQLKPRIDGLDESARKVYGRRLQMCRDFYRFMLENRREGGS